MTLRGLGVLITRPLHQATSLCRLLEAEGARTWKFPALEIRENSANRAQLAAVRNAAAPDLVVFTSSNAVRFGAEVLRDWSSSQTAAIGPATARALNRAGFRVAIVPELGYDSESLLGDPRMQHVTGKRILLVKGAGGRDRLGIELRRRGATVDELAVYVRVCPQPSVRELGQLVDLLGADALQAMTVTSLDLAENLLQMTPAELRSDLDRLTWLVPGDRVAAGLAERGVRAAMLRAASAEDHDLVAALVAWWKIIEP
jgi:uroporphyrinogen-III synthase